MIKPAEVEEEKKENEAEEFKSEEDEVYRVDPNTEVCGF